MEPSLEGVDLKLGRAKKHLDFLDSQRAELLRVQSNRVVGQLDSQTGDYVVRVEGEPPPPEWGVDVSEFAHLLRSSLDNMLWQLILVRGGQPGGATQFPINEDVSDFDRKPKKGPQVPYAERLTAGILADDRTFIEKAQPFQAGDNAKWHPLAMLAHLNNIDKHRFIHTAYAGAATVRAEGAEMIIRSGGETIVISAPDAETRFVPTMWGTGRFGKDSFVGDFPVLVDLTTRRPIFPMNNIPRSDHPTEIAHMPADRVPHANVSVHPPYVLEISFSDRERPMTIFDLRDVCVRVEEIIEHFRPAFV